MNALLLEGGDLRLDSNYPQPVTGPGEALVRIRLAGICATDLEMVKGYAEGFNGILGHEFVGEVVEAAADTWIGQRVVGSINIGCGTCNRCLEQGPEHCEQRQVLGIHRHDGAFADYLTLPLDNLYSIPEQIPDEVAVFTEPVAATAHILDQVELSPSMRMAVVGPGRVGLLIGQVLQISGASVTMVGRSDESLKLPSQMGLTTSLGSDLADSTFDLVVEASGNESGFEQALRLIKPLGTLVLKSTFHGSNYINLSRLVVDEITVVGSRCGSFPAALRLLSDRQIDVMSLIDAEYPLIDGVSALKHATQSGVRKVLLRP